MDMQQILALLDRFSASPLTALEVELEGARVRLEKGRQAVPAPAPAPAQEAGRYITAPLVGTFYASPAPGEAPFAPVGAAVKKGQTVCVLEAMKMMSEVPAPFDCVIEEVLVQDGDLAGFDAPIFRVRER